jgi:hypothetical protein
MTRDDCGPLPENWIDRTEPWEFIEFEHKPADLVRDARVECVRLLNAFASSLESVLARPECSVQHVRIRFFGIAGALGLNIMDGRSFTELADWIGCTKASLSKTACEFTKANNLEPSMMMKSSESSAAYQTARLASIKRNGNGTPAPINHGKACVNARF